jgi:hypothetical protein
MEDGSSGGSEVARWQTAALLAAGMALVAGCAGASEDKAEVGTTSAPTAVTAAPTTVATTTPEVSVAPTETLPPPTTTIPATAPTTVEDVKQAVIAGFERYRAGYIACVSAPNQCNVDSFTLAGSRGNALLRTFVADLAASNRLGQPNLAVDRFEVEGFEIDDATGNAELTVCTIDGGSLIDTRGTQGTEDDVVVDDKTYATRTIWVFGPDADSWSYDHSILVSETEGISCVVD